MKMATELTEAPQARLLSCEAAAVYFNVTGQTIRRLIASGVLQPVQIPTLRRVLLDRNDLDRLIDASKGTNGLENASAQGHNDAA
jgi:excisionase family DNA binding protein